MTLKSGLNEPMFSHVYIEESILGSNEVNQVLDRLPNSTIIPISHYKDVFNKPGQNPEVQQNSKKLILASNNSRRVYSGAPYCHDFGCEAFYYTSQILNCPYNCSYCYLKGKFPSANIVLFTNINDYFLDIEKIAGGTNAFITLSYDSDMCALESILGIFEKWIDFIRLHPSIIFEQRSKSLYFPNHKPLGNLIYAVSLLPQDVIDIYEKGTPSLENRLSLISRLLESGHKVRLCIDPVLDIEEAAAVYKRFIHQLAESVSLKDITDVSVGCFRMPSDYYKNMCSGYSDHFIDYYPFEKKEKQVRYSKAKEKELLDAVLGPLTQFINRNIIFTR